MARFILLLLVLLPHDFLVLADDAIIDIEPLHVVAKNETLAQLIAGHPKVKMNAMINQFYNPSVPPISLSERGGCWLHQQYTMFGNQFKKENL